MAGDIYKTLGINVYAEPKLKLTDDEPAKQSTPSKKADTIFDKPGFFGDVSRTVADTGLGYMTTAANLYNNLTQAQYREGGTPIQDRLIKAHKQIGELQDAADKATLSQIDYAEQQRIQQELANAKGVVENVKAGGKMAWNMLTNPIDNAGKIVGGILDPLNFAPVATGAKVASKLGGGVVPKIVASAGAGAVSNAPVNAIEEGAFAAARGEDWQKAAAAGAGGGAVGGALLGPLGPIVSHVGEKYAADYQARMNPEVMDTSNPTAPLLPLNGEVVDTYAIGDAPQITNQQVVVDTTATPQTLIGSDRAANLLENNGAIYQGMDGWSEPLGNRIQEALDAQAGRDINGIIDAEVDNAMQTHIAGLLSTLDERAGIETEQIKAQTQALISGGADKESVARAVDNIITVSPEDITITNILNDGKPLGSRMMGVRLLPLLENSIRIAEETPHIARTNTEFAAALKKEGVAPELGAAMVNAYAAKDPSILQKYMWEKINANRAQIVDEAVVRARVEDAVAQRAQIEQKIADSTLKEEPQQATIQEIAKESPNIDAIKQGYIKKRSDEIDAQVNEQISYNRPEHADRIRTVADNQKAELSNRFDSGIQKLSTAWENKDFSAINNALIDGLNFDYHKKAIGAIYGVNFGKTKKDARDAVVGHFGDEFLRWEDGQKKAYADEQAKNKKNELARRLSDKVKYNGAVMTTKEWLDAVHSNGFTRIDSKKVGATNRYEVANGQGEHFRISKLQADYIEILNNEKIAEQYQNNSDTILNNNNKGAEDASYELGRADGDTRAGQGADRGRGEGIDPAADTKSRVGAQTARDNAEPNRGSERGADGALRDAGRATIHDSTGESVRGGRKADIAEAKEQVGGLQTDRANADTMGQGDSADGLVSTKADTTDMGASKPIHEQASKTNLDLRDKEPIALTPAARKKANAAAEEVLKKPVEDMTEADRDALRLHTGDGGIDGATGEGIFNQHYTGYEVIRSMYKALSDSGFSFKTALEPAVGSGNFVGHAPKAKWDIVDIDPKNIEISKRLYPETNYAHAGSFETFKGDGYDLIISNVPFASYAALPRDHAHKIQPNFKAIHNFYFAHAIDKVKDDGIVAFITSTGTMDGTGEAAKLRAHLMSKADLIGAYRLPQKSFAKNASTDVMADVIFLQKRPKGVEPRESAKEANALFEGVSDKEGYPINSYFAQHPNKVLGELVIDKDKTKMGKEGWIAKGKARLEDMKVGFEPYIKAEKQEAKGVKEPSIFRDRDELMAYAAENDLYIRDKKGLTFEMTDYDEGEFSTPILAEKKVTFEMHDGEAYIGEPLTDDIGQKLSWLEHIREYVNQFQRSGDDADSRYAQEYARQYSDTFGDFSRDSGLKLFMDKHKLGGLYLDYKHMFGDDGKMAASATEKVRFANSGKVEADINSPLTLRAEFHEDADGVINIGDARLLSEKDIKTLIKDNGYAIIEQDGKMAIQNPAIYYTGHLYTKVQKAEQLTALGLYDAKALETQIQTLKANYPEPKPYSSIEFVGNEQFMADPRIQSALADKAAYLKNSTHVRLYDKALKSEALITKSKEESMDDYLARLKEANDTLKNIIIPAAREHLKNSGVAQLVEERFNNYLNSYKEPKFDGSTLTDVPPQFRGKPLKLLGYQSEGAERIVFNKKGVIAFAPGGGKTITAIVAVRHLMKKGAVKKPVYVVPANTISQWKETIRELYPDMKIKQFSVNKSGKYKGQEKQWSNLSPVEKHEALYDIAHNNYDATVVSYEMFNDILLPEKDFEGYMDDFARAVLADIDDGIDSKSAKAAEKDRIRTEKAIALLKQKFRDTRAAKSHLSITLDQLGFDSIIVDEAHNFKNIGYKGQIVDANLGASVGIRSVLDADGNIVDAVFDGWQTYDMRFKTSFISERNNNNNIIMLTGTPTPNKPMELATILQHLDINLLKEYGIKTPADFARTFFEIEKKEAGKQDGSKDAKNTYSAIKNLSSLHAIKDRYINYLDYDQMPGLVRPEAVWTEHVILQGEVERHIAEDILERLKEAKEAAKKRFQGGAKDGEAIGAVYFSGKDAGTDRRFYFSASTEKYSKLPDDIRAKIRTKETDPKYSKIAKTIELVTEQRVANDKAGQIIFIDRQTANGANIHQEIKQDLIATGKFKPEEIGIANGTQVTNHLTGKEGAKTDANRQALVDAFNAGKVKVIIGTTNSLGVGVDLQKHTTDIYNIDIPWTADEMSQRINRGVRQGNENSKVRVHTFFQMGSYDRLVLGIVQKKIGFNDIFWKQKDKSVSRIEIPPYVAPDYYSLALELETNPIKKQALIVERDFDKLTSAIKEAGDLAKAEDTKYKAKMHWVDNEIPSEIRSLESRKARPELPKYENIKDEAERAAKIEEYKAKYVADIESRIDKKRADIETLRAEAEMIKAKRDARIEKKAELEAEKAQLIEGYMKPTRDGYGVDFDKIAERMDKIEDIYKEEC